MAVNQAGAFYTFEDTLATGIITGSVSLTGTRAQIAPVLPSDFVCGLEIRVFSAVNWVFASADDAAAEVPGPTSLWIPFSTINAHNKLWFRQIGGSGGALNYVIEYKARGATL